MNSIPHGCRYIYFRLSETKISSHITLEIQISVGMNSYAFPCQIINKQCSLKKIWFILLICLCINQIASNRQNYLFVANAIDFFRGHLFYYSMQPVTRRISHSFLCIISLWSDSHLQNYPITSFQITAGSDKIRLLMYHFKTTTEACTWLDLLCEGSVSNGMPSSEKLAIDQILVNTLRVSTVRGQWLKTGILASLASLIKRRRKLFKSYFQCRR